MRFHKLVILDDGYEFATGINNESDEDDSVYNPNHDTDDNDG